VLESAHAAQISYSGSLVADVVATLALVHPDNQEKAKQLTVDLRKMDLIPDTEAAE
jgi:hypothetical protein